MSPDSFVTYVPDRSLWLKQNGFRADQVQAFLPSPMATATAMYHSGKNPLRKVTRDSESVRTPKGLKQRRLHKAFLRYHDANNWPMLRAVLRRMGRGDLIGSGKHQLIPFYQPAGTGQVYEDQRGGKRFATQHTGLPRFDNKKFAAPKRGGRRLPRTLHPGSPTGSGKRPAIM